MEKDFRKWHTKKEKINKVGTVPFFHEREVWFCYVGVNIGFEQDGRGENFLRPMVIIRKFNTHICWAVPLTRTRKDSGHYFRFRIQDRNEESSGILSQVRLIDAHRLSHRIGYISVEDFRELKEKLKALLH